MKSRYIVIRDEHSKLFGHRILNAQLSLYIGLIQLLVCIWALSQHIWSMFTFQKPSPDEYVLIEENIEGLILHCDFSANSTLPPLMTHVDAIIFDIGLFHHLWGITGCVAQHLDGGYGRFLWCILHTGALCACLPFAFIHRPKPQWLWPLLIQQSAYGVGMLILSLAALPKAAHILGDLQNAPLKAICFYAFGTLLNFFLLYVYWHWYWHVESLWNSARRLRRGELLTKSGRRPIRKITCEMPPLPLPKLSMNSSSPQPPPTIMAANDHFPPGEKKQMSVTILLDGNHPGGPSPMPITRIEHQSATQIDQNVQQMESAIATIHQKQQQNQIHSQLNSTKSAPNGQCSTKTLAIGEREQQKIRHNRKRAPKLRKGGPGAGESIESNTSANTATFSTTNTVPANNLAIANSIQQCSQNANEFIENFRPPPSPAPPPNANCAADGHIQSPCLPPRVRHLRKEEGRTKSLRICSNSTNESSRRESTNSGGSASTSAPESRKSSSQDNPSSSIIIGDDTKPTNGHLLPPLSPHFSMPNDQLKSRRQLSLRQRRRLSLRQRNQIAARKQQQLLMEERVLLSRSSLPIIERPNNSSKLKYAEEKHYSSSYAQFSPSHIFPPKMASSNNYWPPNRAILQATGWSSADRLNGLNSNKLAIKSKYGSDNWHSPWTTESSKPILNEQMPENSSLIGAKRPPPPPPTPSTASILQSPKMMSANNIGVGGIFHPQFAGTNFAAGWKRPLDGPISSLPLMAKTNLARERGMVQQMANGNNVYRWHNGGNANSLLPSTKGLMNRQIGGDEISGRYSSTPMATKISPPSPAGRKDLMV